ncbi:tyrosine-protein phosphatase [Anaerolineae bacterium CFX9]|nr:tyrosine-protein phosphatase [Anaerolineae bacterium CFX9]
MTKTRIHPLSLIVEPDVPVEVEVRPSGEWVLRPRASVPITDVYAGMTPETIRRDKPVPFTLEDQAAIIDPHISGLESSSRYYFSVTLIDGSRYITAQRVLPLEGAVNFRDLGGYRTHDGKYTRWGRLFRSGMLAHLTDADVRYLEALGLRLICDLRLPEEAAEHPDRRLTTAQGHSHPIVTETNKLRQMFTLLRYRRRLDQLMLKGYVSTMIDKNARTFGAVYQHLADADSLPAVFHCTAGKDRAGMTTAILLLALGVPEDTIAADYSLSNHYYDSFADQVASQMARLAKLGIDAEAFHPMLLADPNTIRGAIRYLLEKYGSVERYLHDQAGVDEATLARLRSNFLE